MDSTLNDCFERIAQLDSAHARFRFNAPAFLFDIR